MQPITSLGVAELTENELVAVGGGDDSCWCKSLASAFGYALGVIAAEVVDALVSPEDSNSFLGK